MERNHPSLHFSVFISSKDALIDERAAVEAAVRDLGFIPVRVETTTWLATPIPHEYLQQVQRAQLVVLVLAPVNTRVAKDYYKYVEAEVNLALSEGKTILLFYRAGSKLAAQDSFLASLQGRVFSRQFTNTTELFWLVRLSITNELVRRYSGEPRLFKNRRDFFDFAAKFILSTSTRLVLSQLTPTVLFGPRINRPHEQVFYDAILEVAKRSKQDSGPTVILIYNELATEAELKRHSSDYNVARLAEYCDVIRNLVSNRLVVASGPSHTIPYVVVDHKYAIGQAGKSHLIVLVNEGAQVCSELYEIAQVYAAEPPENGIDKFQRMAKEAGLDIM